MDNIMQIIIRIHAQLLFNPIRNGFLNIIINSLGILYLVIGYRNYVKNTLFIQVTSFIVRDEYLYRIHFSGVCFSRWCLMYRLGTGL